MGDKGGSDWTDDPRELLRVDESFDLEGLDRGATPGWSSGKKSATRFCDDRGDLLSELQERLFAEGRAGGNRSLLVVIQGLDTAGKGGVVRHVMGKVDPQGVALHSFGAPTAEEAEHHFLWRIKKALPEPGLVGVFDRSHYEDVLIARVDELVPPEVWEKRYDEINSFEADLVDSGTTVLKLGLMVSHDEQGLRLMKRLDRPDKLWKYSKNDVPTRRKWDKYQDAYADVFRRTSTEAAPWYVIPADHKWYTRLAATELLTQALIEIDPTWPTVRWDPQVQRRELADTMSTRALRKSLKETDRQVKKAVKDDRRVQEEAAQALADVAEDDPIAQAETEARTAEAAAAAATAMLHLQRTRRQKADLVDARREASGSGRE